MLRTLLPFLAIAPATIYSLLTLWCGWKFFHQPLPGTRSPVPGPHPPPVTILKPVKGMDAGSYANFASFCRQEYDGEVQLLFAVASADDPAVAVIRRLMADHPRHDIALVCDPAIHGPNRKVSNLINAFPRASHDIIIVCDSDIRVTPDYLLSVTAHFREPDIGLVTSLYRTSGVHSLATALEATGFTAEMIPNVLVALQLEGLTFALGASMAVRREALASIGGFPALSAYLADDYQLGNKIHRAGWRLALDGCFVESMMNPENMSTVFARQLRWARTMRVSRPGGYLASGITLPFLALIIALIIAPAPSVALAAMALLYTVRLAVCMMFSRLYVRDNLLPRWLWLIPARDMIAFCTWALAFLGNRVTWRGSRFRLGTGGKIEEIV